MQEKLLSTKATIDAVIKHKRHGLHVSNSTNQQCLSLFYPFVMKNIPHIHHTFVKHTLVKKEKKKNSNIFQLSLTEK